MTTERNIAYGNNSLREFKIEKVDEKGKVALMSIGDEQIARPSPRFWTSLCAGYSNQGLSTKLFNLFTHAEVFERLHERLHGSGRDRRRWAIENPGTPKAQLLAVTDPMKPLIEYDSIGHTLARYETVKQEYSSGIMRSTHRPQHMDNFEVGGDGFAHQYVLETPIDGYGFPLIYLSLLRQVCSNGMIGYAKAFRSEISLGKGGPDAVDPSFTLERALDSFSNEEGYAALRQRFETAQGSWASIAETNRIYNVIKKMAEQSMFTNPGSEKAAGCSIDDLALRRGAAIGVGPTLNISAGGEGASLLDSAVNTTIMRAFSQLTGDLCSIYRLTQIDAISAKKQAQLSSRASMYDLLNFATELATHYCTEANGRLLQAEVGNFISCEYDLENTMEAKPDFQDWFTDLSDSDELQD